MSVVMEPSSTQAQDNAMEGSWEASLITQLGLVEGDVLTYVETHGARSLRRIIRDLQWPASLVMMAVGALIREGLVCGIQREIDVVVGPSCAPA